MERSCLRASERERQIRLESTRSQQCLHDWREEHGERSALRRRLREYVAPEGEWGTCDQSEEEDEERERSLNEEEAETGRGEEQADGGHSFRSPFVASLRRVRVRRGTAKEDDAPILREETPGGWDEWN